MTPRLLIACVLVVATFAPAPSAEACRCLPPPPPKEAMAKATVVFVGRVTEVAQNRDQGVMVTFQVERAWKGVDAKQFIITTPNNSCGFRFTKDQEYVVYATGENGQVPGTNLCHRTRAKTAADEDLKELGEGKVPDAAK